MKIYKLNKLIDVDTLYRAETDKAYIIRAVGTDSSSKATFKVAGVPCLEVVSDIAPLEKTSSNLYGPLNLGNYYIVIPQSKTFKFEGASGSKMRIIGEIIELGPNESLPSEYLKRYAEQGKRYLSYVSGSFEKGTDTAWPADEENTVLTYTTPVKERYIFNNILGATVSNVSGGLSRGQFAIRLYVDDKPYDISESIMGKPGIEVIGCHLPPTESTTFEPYTLKDRFIDLTEGKTLKVTAVNISGSSITPDAGTSLTVKTILVCEKHIFE